MSTVEEFNFNSCNDPFVNGPIPNNVCGNIISQCALFVTLFSSIVQNDTRISKSTERIKPVDEPASVYDFIVVGGGNAGAVVAGRLSENPKYNVLLIEAGPDEPNAAFVPSVFGAYLLGDLDWDFRTSNETNACLRNGGQCRWPRGKNLGGTTVHHGMAYHRGNAKDYNGWAETGLPDWSWDKVRPYFLKSEDNREINRVGTKHHSTGGPLPVERFPWQPQIAWDILKGGDELGYGITEDMVGDKITGFTIAQTISDKGVRISSAGSYLRPNRNRPNLHVLINALATKVVFRNKKAIGVQYIKDNKLHAVRAKREVILSGGAVNSPQLLLLSGIGPKEHLEELNIPVIQDLPGVGENLHNHVSFGLNFTVTDPDEDAFPMTPTSRYLTNQTGPLSSTGLAQVTGIIATKYTEPDDPDLQMFFAGFLANCRSLDTPAERIISIIPVNLHAKSRGKLILKSNNPMEPPIIYSRDLTDIRDIKVLTEGIRIALALAEAPSMRKYNVTLVSKPVPECSAHEYMSDEYWECALYYETRTENHQAGSCKMGPSTDPMSVLDTRLRVYGVKGLRVIDAASMPVMVSGNPSAAITMVAERGADFIKEDNTCSKKRRKNLSKNTETHGKAPSGSRDKTHGEGFNHV